VGDAKHFKLNHFTKISALG